MVRSQRRPKQQKQKVPHQQRILIMRHNKILSAAIVLCMVVFFTMGSVPSASASTPVPLTTTGALTVSGPATMHVDLNPFNGVRAHCVVTLIASNGTIVIDQQCQFATSPPKGRWEIVGGTGAYANLNGNGSLTMPPPLTEAMTGVIYLH